MTKCVSFIELRVNEYACMRRIYVATNKTTSILLEWNWWIHRNEAFERGIAFFSVPTQKKIDHITHLFISEKSIPRQNCALGFAHQFHDGCVALHVPLLPHFQLKICTNMQKQKLLFSKLTLTTKKYIVCDYYCVDSHFDVRLSNLMRQ